jgi:MerR family copper efflux transcriptional regulator
VARPLTIGTLARRAGVGLQTVRYYQRRNLLPIPPRSGRSIRIYPAETLALLRFIRKAQGLGFTLKEIETLLELRKKTRGACEEVARAFEAKVADLGERIRTLELMRADLVRVMKACEHGGGGRCKVLEVLYFDDDPSTDDSPGLEPVGKRSAMMVNRLARLPRK